MMESLLIVISGFAMELQVLGLQRGSAFGIRQNGRDGNFDRADFGLGSSALVAVR
jgi:hypothetical protein